MSDIDRHDDDEELDPEALFAGHRRSGEPLGGHEVRAIVSAGLAEQSDFGMTGGDLWLHLKTFPDPDADDAPPVVQAGDPCPGHEDRTSAEEPAVLTCTSDPGIPIEIRDGQPVCSTCGGPVQCSGVLKCSMVDVNADCFGDGGVDLTYDYLDAGAAEFVPDGFHCVNCGATLYDPGDLRCHGGDDGIGPHDETDD